MDLFRNMIHKTLFFVYLCLLVVNGVDADVMKSVSVMEGDSVTLNTDVTEIQRADQILWMFGPKGALVAQIIKSASLSRLYDDDNNIFRDRLHLDSQTGSLTIRNIKITHSGLYKLQIVNGTPIFRSFNVTVYALIIPVITRNSSQCSSSSERSSSSKCVLLCSVNVTQVTLSWYKGNSLLSSISVSDLNTLSLPLEVEYQDNNTYSCVVNNPIRNQTKHLYITDLCQLCPVSDSHVAVYICVPVVFILTLLVIAGVGKYYYSNIYRRTRQEVEDGAEDIHYATTTFYAQRENQMRANGGDNTVYASVRS